MNIDLYKYLLIHYCEYMDDDIDNDNINILSKKKSLYFSKKDYYIINSENNSENNICNSTFCTFSHCFNNIIKIGIIPNTIIRIVFPDNFNQILLENTIPHSVTHIKFGYHYNQPIYHNVLPNNLKELIFENNFNQEFQDKVLPDSILYLTLKSSYQYKLNKNNLPKKLKQLSISPNHIGEIEIEEKSYFHLIIDKLIDQGFEDDNTHYSINHNSSVFYMLNLEDKKIITSNNLNIKLPFGITKLTLGLFFDKKINKNDIPESVIELNVFSVKSIYFDDNVLPESIIYLNLNGSCSKITENTIPKKVKYLIFGNKFEHNFTKNMIPDSVIYLQLGYRFTHRLKNNILPKNLLNLVFFRDNKNFKSKNTNNKFILGKIENDDKLIEYIYNDKYIILSLDYINDFNKFIESFSNKYIGKIIFEELVSKVFNPQRMLKICRLYNIEFDDLMEIY
jgi:hypothetical protein